ncbi:sugar phosphate isomerase/epimerase [Phytoactinopolyspora alkaliphila]|uniref:Sugar phosphate isomerase/epimerase n=1 Tax=Phytoactinopolyspora alkaliphila TaxID=1783498 RepID=A0A6N9YSU8_9ACTN|nr:sugar phosphate isomerase/epimerase [Phytoactinopolyspora alkaliphila]NED98020.1 sugar phosphate isomerase/epimerase [Phytoactinopolyspora alkaliphila]
MSTPLAVQLYSARDRLADDRAGVLRRLAEIGYAAVEPFAPTDDPAGFRRIADDLGLAVCATHATGLMRGEDAAEIFDAVHTLGTELVIVPGGIPREEFATADGLARIADRLNGIADQARARGLRFGYHNHDHELEYIVDGRHALDVLADLLAPEIFLEIDTYWAAVGGADVPDLLRRHGDRVRLLHVKDGPVVRGEPNVAVGEGEIPVEDYLAAAPDAWRVVEFDTCATDVLDALEASYRYLATLDRSGEGA